MYPHTTLLVTPRHCSEQDPAGVRNLLAQVGIDQFVHHPLMYFPVFYMIKDFVTNEAGPDPVGAVKEYIGNMQEDLAALWKGRPNSNSNPDPGPDLNPDPAPDPARNPNPDGAPP